MKIEIDEDIIKSLYGFFFGDVTDNYKAATYRAYRDFNRTIKFPAAIKELGDNDEKKVKDSLKDSVVDIFKREIPSLHGNQNIGQESFDKWHKGVCNKIISTYKEKGIDLTYGQAQKWINMTIKYLYCLKEYDFNKEFQYLHVPIDNYVLKTAKEQFKLNKPKDTWSKWSADDYTQYQNDLRKKIKGLNTSMDPLRWEFTSWLKEAKNSNDEEENKTAL